MSEPFLTAIVLGIVEGLTEFIPVSSTGHLILVGKILGFEGEQAASFEIFIQLGAILAVLVLYHKRFRQLLSFERPDTQRPFEFAGIRGILLLAAACLPVFILGPILHHPIKKHLFGSNTVAWALIVGGLLMVYLERKPKERQTCSLDQISLKQALLIGFFQCFSLWPGVSRAAATILGGIFLGLDRKTAAEFSFLVAVPVMCAATLFDFLKNTSLLTSSQLGFFALGFVVSFIIALVAVSFFLKLITRYSFVPFGIYRVFIGVLVLIFM